MVSTGHEAAATVEGLTYELNAMGDDARTCAAADLAFHSTDYHPDWEPARVRRQVEHLLVDIRLVDWPGRWLLDCVYGNPLRPLTVPAGWRTPTVLALADGIYAGRAFDRLPVLADAIEDAGCDHAGLLAHCRDGGPHARGCWALDRLLDKPDEPPG
jgi:hypothetical protein